MKFIFVIVTIILSVSNAVPLHDRIVGGELAEDGQFPYEVSLRYLGRHRCGACIINEIWILTAAHCVVGTDSRDLSVIAGTIKLNQGGQSYKAEYYFYHEMYSSDVDTAVNDVAVIKLRSKIVFSELIQPIALNTKEISSGDDLLLSGWGQDGYPDGRVSQTLKFLKMKALNTTECQERFQKLGYEIFDTQLCGFANNEEGICFGDSGSPLVFNGRVAGLASWVEPCGIGYPDVYTRVSTFVDWIEEKIALH